jgi:CBS domain-containing protein
MCEPMLKIRDLMCKQVITAKEDISIQDAIQILNDRHVGSLVVIDDQEKCRGIFTERDAIRVMAHKFALDKPLSTVMSKHVVVVSIEASFDEAKEIMFSHKVRHLPVTDQTGKVIGLFTLRAFFDEIMGIKTPLASSS